MTRLANQTWFDRLSVSLTRRGALATAIAGAASLALPLRFLRSGAAHAAATDDCATGCLFTSDVKFQRARANCQLDYAAYALLATNPLAYVAGFGKILSEIPCIDAALLAHKARSFDCYKPNCAGFDPRGKDGPCETAPKSANCCPCKAVVTGYIPCYPACKECCPGG